MKKKVKLDKEHKFCPNCGAVLRKSDAYCIRCGYNFVDRFKKNKNPWKKIILIILIFLVAYTILRKFILHKPILPDFSALFKFSKTG